MPDEQNKKLNVSIQANTLVTILGTLIIAILGYTLKLQLSAIEESQSKASIQLRADTASTYETQSDHTKDIVEMKTWMVKLQDGERLTNEQITQMNLALQRIADAQEQRNQIRNN